MYKVLGAKCATWNGCNQECQTNVQHEQICSWSTKSRQSCSRLSRESQSAGGVEDRKGSPVSVLAAAPLKHNCPQFSNSPLSSAGRRKQTVRVSDGLIIWCNFLIIPDKRVKVRMLHEDKITHVVVLKVFCSLRSLQRNLLQELTAKIFFRYRSLQKLWVSFSLSFLSKVSYIIIKREFQQNRSGLCKIVLFC